MTRIKLTDNWRVRALSELLLPVNPGVVWGQMRDLKRFITLDPLHKQVLTRDAERGTPLSVGTPLLIRHRILGIGPDRVGRLLTWREGRGYAVSDLSRRGTRTGFPHVCTYDVTPNGEAGCRLRLEARGVWTARWLPRLLVRAWLWWVSKATEGRVLEEIAWAELRKRQSRRRRALPRYHFTTLNTFE